MLPRAGHDSPTVRETLGQFDNVTVVDGAVAAIAGLRIEDYIALRGTEGEFCIDRRLIPASERGRR